METSQVLYQFNSDDSFLHQLIRMNKQLKQLTVTIDANSRAQQGGRPPQYVVHQHQWRRTPKTQKPLLLFPFNVLAAGIDGLLNRCDHAVGQWIKEGILARWMHRIRSWLRNRRRA